MQKNSWRSSVVWPRCKKIIFFKIFLTRVSISFICHIFFMTDNSSYHSKLFHFDFLWYRLFSTTDPLSMSGTKFLKLEIKVNGKFSNPKEAKIKKWMEFFLKAINVFEVGISSLHISSFCTVFLGLLLSLYRYSKSSTYKLYNWE